METVSYEDFALGISHRISGKRIPLRGTIEVTRRCPLAWRGRIWLASGSKIGAIFFPEPWKREFGQRYERARSGIAPSHLLLSPFVGLSRDGICPDAFHPVGISGSMPRAYLQTRKERTHTGKKDQQVVVKNSGEEGLALCHLQGGLIGPFPDSGVMDSMKSQTPSTKLQTNVKFQYQMTETNLEF